MLRDSKTSTEFDEFAIAAWPRLCRAARMLTDDPYEAEDLTQTALARTYAAWRRVRRDDAYAYARRVLVNATIDRHRRRRWREVAGELRTSTSTVKSTASRALAKLRVIHGESMAEEQRANPDWARDDPFTALFVVYPGHGVASAKWVRSDGTRIPLQSSTDVVPGATVLWARTDADETDTTGEVVVSGPDGDVLAACALRQCGFAWTDQSYGGTP